jgi:hypothetical protein
MNNTTRFVRYNESYCIFTQASYRIIHQGNNRIYIYSEMDMQNDFLHTFLLF